MDDLGFYYELQRLAALLHDAHTKVESDPIYSTIKEHYLPFNIEQINNKWYLTSCYKEEDKQYLSYELIEVNEISITDILKKAEPYISYENKIRLEDMFTQIINHSDFLKHIEIIHDINDVTLTILNHEGEKIKIKTESYSWKDIQKAQYNSVYQAPETKRNKDKFYEFFSLNKNALLIRYNKAREDTQYLLSQFNLELKKEIKGNQYSKIIVDLRDNKGGNYTLFPPTIQMIKKLKEKQNFEVYGLISKNTFSSGVIHAAQLQHEVNAVLVGSPTGGNVYTYGDTTDIELSNSDLTIMYSTGYLEGVPGYQQDALYPDLEVEHTIKDYMAGVDKEIETILDGDEIKLEPIKTTNSEEVQSVVIDNVEVKYYDDNSPYLHDIISNNTDRTIAGYQIGMLAYDKKGKPLEQYWTGPNNKKSYFHLYEAKRVYLFPGQKSNQDGGWSLNEKTKVAYAVYCIKEVTFDNGEVWKNPDYDKWKKTYLKKTIDISILQTYYPFVQKLR